MQRKTAPFPTACWWLTHPAAITGVSVSARWDSPGGGGGPSVSLLCNCRVQNFKSLTRENPHQSKQGSILCLQLMPYPQGQQGSWEKRTLDHLASNNTKQPGGGGGWLLDIPSTC